MKCQNTKQFNFKQIHFMYLMCDACMHIHDKKKLSHKYISYSFCFIKDKGGVANECGFTTE